MPHLHQLHAGDGADEVARLLANALSVREVACILVGHAHLHLSVRRRQANLDEPLGQVFDTSFQLGVEVLEVRAAAG